MQPRVPVAGVKRRWGGRPSSGAPGSLQLQDSSTEVTSSGVLSLSLQQPPPPPPSHYETAASESAADTPTPEAADQTSQLWNLDLPMRTSSCTASGSSVVHISTSSNSINSSTNNSQQRSNLKMVASINTTSGLLMPSLTHQETSSLSSVACPSGIIEGRDDLSPQSSLNGYNAESCDAKKKKGPTPRQQEELCLVCGDRASGYHYNALTCEGCKGFFRRSITKNAVYQCKYGNNCEIDMYMRRKCQECRLKKCLHVGMRPECVVPEFQCAVKRKEKKAQKDKDKPNSTTMNGSTGVICTADISYVKMEHPDPEPFTTGIKHVSPEQEELINRLVYFQDEYEQPNDEDLKRITNQPLETENPSDLRFRHITEITILTVQLIVEFAKRLPGFDKLRYEDKIVLLKACSSEVMILRMARKYDFQTDSIIFATNQSYSRDSYLQAGIGDIIDDLLRFGRFMYSMKVNNAEYALLTAIVVFSERPNVAEGWKVEKIQEIYLDALKAYVEGRWKPKASAKFAKLLSVLTELRTLGNQNIETCSNLKLKNKKLPPFLAEIWDVAS